MSAINLFIQRNFPGRVINSYCQHVNKRYISDNKQLDDNWQNLQLKNNNLDEKLKKSPLKNLLDNSATFEDIHPKTIQDVWATQPYTNVLQKYVEEETMVDPKDTCVILFPGQGTQYIGMGKELLKFPKVKELYSVAKEVIGFDLLEISTEKELEKHCQLSVMVASLAAVERLREERPSAINTCITTAGFSLGEITALVFAGAIPFEQALKLVSIRAAAMEAASQERPGGMVTVMYGPDTEIRQVCNKALEYCVNTGVNNPYCSIANYLYPHCKVISGSLEALNFIEKNRRDLGIRRIKRLPVSGAFHSEGVRAAVEPMKAAMKLCTIRDPEIRVLSGIDGKAYRNASHIYSRLPKQIVHPVKWQQLLQNLYVRPSDQSHPRTFEVGPGGTLRTILRKVNARAWDSCHSITA